MNLQMNVELESGHLHALAPLLYLVGGTLPFAVLTIVSKESLNWMIMFSTFDGKHSVFLMD